jgi:hypothetical protein
VQQRQFGQPSGSASVVEATHFGSVFRGPPSTHSCCEAFIAAYVSSAPGQGGQPIYEWIEVHPIMEEAPASTD